MLEPRLLNQLRLVAVSQAEVNKVSKTLQSKSERRAKRVITAYNLGATISQIVAIGTVPHSTVYKILNRAKEEGHVRTRQQKRSEKWY